MFPENSWCSPASVRGIRGLVRNQHDEAPSLAPELYYTCAREAGTSVPSSRGVVQGPCPAATSPSFSPPRYGMACMDVLTACTYSARPRAGHTETQEQGKQHGGRGRTSGNKRREGHTHCASPAQWQDGRCPMQRAQRCSPCTSRGLASWCTASSALKVTALGHTTTSPWDWEAACQPALTHQATSRLKTSQTYSLLYLRVLS